MKNILYILTGILITGIILQNTAYAQKPTKKVVSIYYKQMPLHPLSESLKTVQTIVNLPELGISISKAEIINSVKGLSGYQNTKTEGDIIIEYTLSDIEIESTENMINTVQLDPNNPATKKDYHYMKIKYLQPYFVSMKDKNGQVYKAMVVGANLLKEYTFGLDDDNKFTTSGQLSIAYKEKKTDILRRLKIESTKKILQSEHDELEGLYGYPHKKQNVTITNGKGKMDYSDLDQALQSMKEAESLSKAKNYKASREKIQQAVNLWEKALLEADYSNKKARISPKIAKGLKINLLSIYGFIEQYDKAYAYATEVLSMKKPGLFTKGIVEDYVTFTKNLQERNSAGKEDVADRGDNTTPQKRKSKFIASLERFNDNSGNVSSKSTIVGTWLLSSMKSKYGRDLNKDGEVSEELMYERDACLNAYYLHIKPDRSMLMQTGTMELGCDIKTEDFYWIIKTNKADNGKYFLFDTEKEIDLSIANYFKIEELTSVKLVMKGDFYLGGDTTTEGTLTFERVWEEN